VAAEYFAGFGRWSGQVSIRELANVLLSGVSTPGTPAFLFTSLTPMRRAGVTGRRRAQPEHRAQRPE